MLKLNNPICFIGQFYSDEARIIGDKPPASNEWPIIGNGSQKGRATGTHHSKMQKDGWAKYIPNFDFK